MKANMSAPWCPSRRRVNTYWYIKMCHRHKFSSQIIGAMQPNTLTDLWFIQCRIRYCRESPPGAWKWSNYQQRQHHKVGLLIWHLNIYHQFLFVFMCFHFMCLDLKHFLLQIWPYTSSNTQWRHTNQRSHIWGTALIFDCHISAR